jgi:hypothetical protein
VHCRPSGGRHGASYSATTKQQKQRPALKRALEMNSLVHDYQSVGVELTQPPLYAPDPVYSSHLDLETQTFILLLLVPLHIGRRISRFASLSSCWWSRSRADAAGAFPDNVLELLLPAGAVGGLLAGGMTPLHALRFSYNTSQVSSGYSTLV